MQRNVWILAAVAAHLAVLGASHAQERNPVRRAPSAAANAVSARVIVKFKPSATAANGRVPAPAADDRVAALAARARLPAQRDRALGAGLHVLDLDPAQPVEQQLARLRADTDVEYAEPDRRRYAHAVPNDPLFAQQWYLKSDAATPSAVNAQQAWDTTMGSDAIVIAVLDTGVRFDHPDLGRVGQGGRLLDGYDFVSDPAVANDGDGRDADASDPGDFVTQTDAGTQKFSGCGVSSSSWHGTRVAGIIGASANNGVGISGETWNPWILPVRVLGKCGGFDSDILAGMEWAAGIHVAGVPDNPYPARIVNMSLGSTETCTSAYAAVIAELANAGVVVIASAGNEGGPVDTPANCQRAVGVGALRQVGTKVGFSSLGPELALSAPGGNCVNLSGECLYPINTTTNLGSTTPAANGYTDGFNINVGTSFSAPIVSGIGGLMLSVNGNLTAAQVRARLIEGVAAFPVSTDATVPQCHVPAGPNDVQVSECNCTASTCGAGMANASGAVLAALRPIAAVVTPNTVSPGQAVALSAAGSMAADGHTIASYAWLGTSLASAPDQPGVTAVAPTSGSTLVCVTVTDDAGRQDTAVVSVRPTSAAWASASAGTNPCLIVMVTVTPSLVSVTAGAGQTFLATVANSTNTAVAWSVNGISGGDDTVGTISAAGLYTAPASVAAAFNVLIAAAWADDSTRFGTAQVTVNPPPPPPPPPAPQTSSGGGATGMLELLALGVVGLLRRRHLARSTAS
jgi:serine protease